MYRINLSLNGQHLFAFEQENRNKAILLLRLLNSKFLAYEGYKISIARIETIGYDRTEDLLAEAESEYLKDYSIGILETKGMINPYL